LCRFGLRLTIWPAIAHSSQRCGVCYRAQVCGPNPFAFTLVGQSAGGLTVEALSRTCDNLTREGLMEAVESFKDYQDDLALRGHYHHSQ
jgi:hypothetical protein